MNISTKLKHPKNPFILELEGKMYLQPRANTIIAQGEAIVDQATGEIVKGGILVGRRKLVDKSQFAKIYASEIGILFNLSKPATNVFLYLSKRMDFENKAHFRWKELYKNYGNAYKGLRELIKENIIAPSDIQNVYWLNPTIICKGERFAIYTEYIQDNTDKTGNQMLSDQIKEDKEKFNTKTKEKINLAEQSTNPPKDLFS